MFRSGNPCFFLVLRKDRVVVAGAREEKMKRRGEKGKGKIEEGEREDEDREEFLYISLTRNNKLRGLQTLIELELNPTKHNTLSKAKKE